VSVRTHVIVQGGFALWVRLQGRADEPDPVDHSLMFEFVEPLDVLAAKLGVTPLSAFYDWTDHEANLAPGDDDESRVVGRTRWYEAPALAPRASG
jgi:hypothetical protein